MKRFLGILLLVLAVGIFPGMLVAQQSAPGPADKETMTAPNGATDQPAPGKAHRGHGKRHGGGEKWAAKHEQLQQQLNDLDKKLDEKIAAMNAATGDQKMAAMSDVITEMASQRKQMVDMFRTYHARMSERMRGRMRGGMGGKDGGMHCPGMQGGGMGHGAAMNCPRMQDGGGCCAHMREHGDHQAHGAMKRNDLRLKNTSILQ